MIDPAVTSYYWVLPNTFLAGEYPRNFDEETSRQKIGTLVKMGVDAFIDLTEASDGLKPYAHLLGAYESQGVSHQSFPIKDLLSREGWFMCIAGEGSAVPE
jgi:hypothetical protein